MKWKAGVGVMILIAATVAGWLWWDRMETDWIENEPVAALDCGYAARLRAVEFPRRGGGDVAQTATECLLEVVNGLPSDQRQRAAALARSYGYGKEPGMWLPTPNAPRDDELWDVADAETVSAQLATCDGATHVGWRDAAQEDLDTLFGLLELRHARAALMGTEGLAERLAAIRQTADVAMLSPTSGYIQLARWVRGFVHAVALEDGEVANEWADDIDEIADRYPNVAYMAHIVGLEVFPSVRGDEFANADTQLAQCSFDVGMPGVWGRCDAECFQQQIDAAPFDVTERIVRSPLFIHLAAASLRAGPSSFAGIDIVPTARPGWRRCWGVHFPNEDDDMMMCATSVARVAAELESRRLWMAISRYRQQTGDWPTPREDTLDDDGKVVRADWDSIGFRPEAENVVMAIRSAAGLDLEDTELLLQARYRDKSDEPSIVIELSIGFRDGHPAVQPQFYVSSDSATKSQEPANPPQ